mgnify:FL=1
MKNLLLKINFIVCLIFLFSYSTLMASEEAKYNIVKKNDIYEIRYYSDRLIVQVPNKGDNNSFRKLFKYISGENKNSEKIAMTVPVTQTKKDDQMFMQFYLPSKFNKETTPIPNNPDLEITTIPKGYFAVIKFSGRSSDKNFDKHNKILKQKLLEDNISIKGFAIRATYNSPFTLPPLRRNESMFSVNWKE